MGWRDAVARGWRVVPLAGKVPQIDLWQRRASLTPEAPDEDPDEFEHPWPDDWPEDRNYGIATGPISGILVLDIDLKADGPAVLASWERDHGELPETYTVRSGGGGEHRYFLFPPELSNVALKFLLCPGVEVKGVGKQVVGEGSRHPDTGELYRVEKDLPLAPCPRHLIRFIGKAGRDEHPERLEPRVDPAEILAGIEQGQQNNKLFAYTCRLRRLGVSELEAVTLVGHAMNACRPVYQKETAVSMVDRVWQTYEGRPVPQDRSTWKLSLGLDDPDDVAVVAPAFLERDDGQALFYPASINMMFGPPGSIKSWIVVKACVQALAAGYGVFYFDFEHRRSGIISRLLNLGADVDAILERFFYARPRDEPVDVHLLEEQVTTYNPALVILDGLNAAMGIEKLEWEKGSDVAQWYDRVPRRLARFGAGVIMTDHVVKDPEARGKFGIGSERKLALIDGVAFQVKPVREDANLTVVRLHISKDRVGQVHMVGSGDRAAEGWLRGEVIEGQEVWSLDIRPPGAPAAGGNGQQPATLFDPTWYMEKVSRFVEDNPGCTSTAIDQGVGGKTQHRRKAIERLVELEYVRREGDGKRSYTSHKPYREADE